MDRIPDSGSDDASSNLAGCTNGLSIKNTFIKLKSVRAMKKSIIILSFTLLILALMAGCSGNDESLNATRLRISLTDEPMPSRAESFITYEMNVDIQKIEVSLVDTIDNSENWVTLDYNAGKHNILALTNGKSIQIVDQYFPAGVLRRIRVVFGDNNYLKTSKGDKNLILDSSVKDGVVVTVNANLYANYVTNILVDINAALSVYEQNDNYFFKPVIRVFPETYGGILKGYVLPREANPQVVIANEKDTLLSLPEAADGLFVFKGLDEGEWDIYIFADPSTGYRDTIFSDSIYVGKTTEIKSKIQLRRIVEGEDTDEELDPDPDPDEDDEN